MRRLTYLAAAAAATTALALIPLAAASTSTASPVTATAAPFYSGWGGYVAMAPKGTTISDVTATFTIPKALPGNSIGFPIPYRAAMWAGMDGIAPAYNGVEQAGVWETSWGKYGGSPQYLLFWEMAPAGPHFFWTANVKPGDIVQVIVAAPGESYPYNDGKFHMTLVVNGTTTYSAAAAVAEGATNTRRSAEVITEKQTYSGALDMGTVHYTYADYLLRDPKSPKPEGPYAVTQTRVVMYDAFTPLRYASIWPSRPSATDPTYNPGLKDAFTTNFYHFGW